MTKGLIGVIVHVYKVEKYIAECIESILAQTYTNFRLIIVDDGSPDNSSKRCDEYAKKDSRITVSFKSTPEYEQLYQEQLAVSIPSEEKSRMATRGRVIHRSR